jgi:DNA-binding HxlR family transcriptional regulator
LSYVVVLILYAAAKTTEIYDHEIAAQLGTMTGHTLKHLLATLAAAVIVARLAARQRPVRH